MRTPNEKVRGNLLIATYSILLAFILINISNIFGIFKNVVSYIQPFIIGFGIAFTLNILVKIFENKVIPFFDKKDKLKKSKRGLSLLAALVSLFIFVYTLFIFVIPQLADSMKILINSIPDYFKSLEEMVAPIVNSTDMLKTLWNNVMGTWQELMQIIGQVLSQSLSGLLNTTFSITSGVITSIVSFVISIYMILNKEYLIRQAKKVLYAISTKKFADKIVHIGKLSDDIFSKFIGGQCLEAIIIGILCFIGMLIFNMPYPLLISVIIGVTNLLPMFGPFIGTIPSSFIILMVDPMKALWFIVFIIILQQLESNLIYPKVVGGSIGLSPIWVLFGITVGGKAFGLLGMLLGVPTMAVIYKLIRESINKRLANKNIKIK